MAHTELDLREGRAFEDMLNAKVSVSKIAAEICSQALWLLDLRSCFSRQAVWSSFSFVVCRRPSFEKI